MAVSAISVANEFYAALGTSSGELEIHRINFAKKRLEKKHTFKFRGSVLSMQKVKLQSGVLIIVGLSSGDISIVHFDG